MHLQQMGVGSLRNSFEDEEIHRLNNDIKQMSEFYKKIILYNSDSVSVYIRILTYSKKLL